jgi:hypothetical protein
LFITTQQTIAENMNNQSNQTFKDYIFQIHQLYPDPKYAVNLCDVTRFLETDKENRTLFLQWGILFLESLIKATEESIAVNMLKQYQMPVCKLIFDNMALALSFGIEDPQESIEILSQCEAHVLKLIMSQNKSLLCIVGRLLVLHPNLILPMFHKGFMVLLNTFSKFATPVCKLWFSELVAIVKSLNNHGFISSIVVLIHDYITQVISGSVSGTHLIHF